MRSVFFVGLYFLIGILAFLFLYLGAEAVLSRIQGSSNSESSSPDYELYVLSNGVHTDIVFPVKSDIIDWRTFFSTDNVRSKDSSYRFVAIGWGDKGFYLNTPEWKDLKVSTALVAALGVGETAVHVTYYRNMHENENCYRINIDSLQFLKLKDYILSSIDIDDNNRAIPIQTTAHYGEDDAFYEAKGAYSIFYSCNTWANQALKKANMPSAVWTVFDKGILRHYQ